jgi:UDP:flavonoid glycosyltransferase YjiC (YdhE family)
MRIVFASVGAYGHLISLLPLAIAAKDAGHDVTFATDSRLHGAIRDAGLEAVHAGTTISDAVAEVVAQTPAGSRSDVPPRAFGSVLPRRTIADLAPVLADKRPDLVVYEVLNPGAGIAAGMVGIPAVCHGTSRVSGGANWKAMCDTWMATAAEFGLDIPEENAEFFGNPYIDICPPSLQWPLFLESVNRVPMRPVAWNQPAELPAFVRDRHSARPLVYLTLGTLFTKPEVLRHVIDGLAVLSVDVLVSCARGVKRDDIGEVPPNVAVEEWVPQGEVLSHADLVVSHGGSGTTLETMARGLPHLVLPQGADQFSNAQVVSDAGLARRILPSELTSEAVTVHARELLADEQVRTSAVAVAKEIAGMPSPQETVEWLAGLTGRA